MVIQNIIGVVVSLLVSSILFVYIHLRDNEDKGIKTVLKIFYDKKKLLLFIFMLVCSIGTWFYDRYRVSLPIEKSYMNSIVFIIVIAMGFIDYKERIIPNILVISGMGIWFVYSLIRILIRKTPISTVFMFSFLGFLLCGGVLLALAIVLKKGLGMGDVKMFAMLGLLYGVSNGYALLICTTIPMAVVAIILLVGKKVSKKSTMPMAPYVVFAFLIGVLSGM